ncbi:MAG: acyltransferase [Proteobacteria bacterium]|nr:acyltransferase [Pseudomonadota bacterium]
MPTNQAGVKLERLEALRGLAALYVVIHHFVVNDEALAGSRISYLFRFGQEAVILFFLLSGFVINYSFKSAADKSFRSYFLKRSARIYIPLLMVMALGWVIECARAGQLADPDLKTLALNLLMLQDVAGLKPNVIVEPYMNNGPLWSLSYEWWFYMLYFPLQKYLDSDRRRDMVVACAAALAALVYFFHPVFVPRVFMYLSIWWLGVALSNAYLRDKAMRLSHLAVPLGSIALVCLVNALAVNRSVVDGSFVSIGVHPSLELRHHLFALVAAFSGLAWHSMGWLFFDRLLAPFQAFAPLSYVIYISHHYFVVDATYLSFLENRLIEFCGYLALLLAFSYLVEIKFYPALQKRFLRLTMASS